MAGPELQFFKIPLECGVEMVYNFMRFVLSTQEFGHVRFKDV